MHKKTLILFFLLFLTTQFATSVLAQNIGIGLTTPAGKLHIKGTSNASQLIIDAHSTQTNLNPLIRLRKSDGTNLLWIHADHPFNTFIGLYAGSVNNAAGGGLYNTFTGRDAGLSNTTGYSNTGHGFQTLQFNTTGIGNTAHGVSALQSNTIGDFNTAIGGAALEYNTTASENTAIGLKALFSQSFNPGYSWISANVAVGSFALYSNQPTLDYNGMDNTAIGSKALYSNTIGSQNISLGNNALYSNTLGFGNIAIGFNAMYSNTKGSYNTANGYEALYDNTTASRNVAIGRNALYNQSFDNGGTVWNSNNTAIGHEALYYNEPTSTGTGINNTAAGKSALRSNTTGHSNTASGYEALFSNTTTNYNTAFGAGSLYSSIASYNTAVGFNALYSMTTGYDNVAVGDFALYNNVDGHDNVAIGSQAGTADYASNASNTISIGNYGYLNGASNQAFIGNLSTNWIGGQTTWFTYASDARVKNNAVEDVKGLEFILKLRPVTYNLNIHAMREITGNKETADYPEKYDIEKIKQSGFLAQEVEQAAVEAGYSFSGITIPGNKNELYTMSYAQFVVPLVKAVQELSAKNNMQSLVIEQLTQRIEKLEASERIRDNFK